jgi:hypothetical protein
MKRWAGHVACIGRREMRTEFWWERDYLGDLDIGGRVLSKWILN